MTAGTRLGPYTITGPLGAGGMGEVYRATDTRLKRQVAVKILPPAVAGDSDRLARFEREAEVLASLSHPHIATVYGLEDSGGPKALVMELVEGPTLADRIAHGAIPLDEALPVARQIAEALEAAHERGIVHRDLKPANIKVREDGTVKVLDFGLAKLAERDAAVVPGGHDPAKSPTITSPAMTAMGVILGTAAYMSPEQARGRTVDKRTDIWAFGAVLYEMLTGRRAFPGEDVTDTMASVVKSTPDWTALPADVPPAIVTLIQRCLEKDRQRRVGDIAVARFLLADHATLGGPTPMPALAASRGRRDWRRAALWALPALLIGVVVGLSVPRGAQTPAPPVAHLQMGVQPAEHLVGSVASVRPSRTAIAISPDGRTVVFAGMRGSVMQLYVRALDRPEAAPLAGTEGAAAPFFSPDGEWIGFWADNRLMKVRPAGGPAAVVTELPENRYWGASWAEDGTIVVAGATGIFRVPSAGGTPVQITTADATKGERHLLPQLLSGGQFLIYTAVSSEDWNTSNVVLQPLGGGEPRVLMSGADGRYLASGHLVFMKAGMLMAVPFNRQSQTVTGDAVALVDGVMQGVNAPNGADETGAGQFAISASGTLVYVAGGIGRVRERSLLWVNRQGVAQTLGTWTGPYMSPRLSPDGRRIAVAARRGANRMTDIWMYDIARDAPTRLTFDRSNNSPVWSPDSRRLVYASGSLHALDVYAGGTPEELASSEYLQVPSSWSLRSNMIVFLQRPGPGEMSSGIWVLPMNEPAGSRTPRLFLQSRFSLTHPDISPDGRWIAYASNESGAREVYVQPYPGPGEKIRISTEGGTRPGEYDSTGPTRGWDVSADGTRFLLGRQIAVDESPVTSMHVVVNWTEALKRLAPAN